MLLTRGLAESAAFKVEGDVPATGADGGVDLVPADAIGGGGRFQGCSTETVESVSAEASGLTATSSCCLALWAAARALSRSRCAGPFCLCLGWC